MKPVITSGIARVGLGRLTTGKCSADLHFARDNLFGPVYASLSAQAKAMQAAQMGLRGHLGGGLGRARYEGVGWSSQSPRDAIR